MKVLIAYDGSKCSEAAIDDLVRAGLPERGKMLALSVAEVWLPPVGGDASTLNSLDAHTRATIESSYRKNEKAVAEVVTLSTHAKKRLERHFPHWKVEAEGTYGSPAWEILSRAEQFGSDLIVVGSHGRSAITRFFLGSISQKVLTEARCSVRVARGRVEIDPAPIRVVIGFDGTDGANAAAESVAGRNWASDTEVQLLTAADNISPTAIGRFLPPIADIVDNMNDSERDWIEREAGRAVQKLSSAGLKTSLHIHPGNPKAVIPDMAEKWNADCIFVGANRFGGAIERLLLGSTSGAVAARASCSVEVVRNGLGTTRSITRSAGQPPHGSS